MKTYLGRKWHLLIAVLEASYYSLVASPSLPAVGGARYERTASYYNRATGICPLSTALYKTTCIIFVHTHIHSATLQTQCSFYQAFYLTGTICTPSLRTWCMHLQGWYLACENFLFPPFLEKVRKSIICYGLIGLVYTYHAGVVIVNDCWVLYGLYSLLTSTGSSFNYRVVINTREGRHNSIHPSRYVITSPFCTFSSWTSQVSPFCSAWLYHSFQSHFHRAFYTGLDLCSCQKEVVPLPRRSAVRKRTTWLDNGKLTSRSSDCPVKMSKFHV